MGKSACYTISRVATPDRLPSDVAEILRKLIAETFPEDNKCALPGRYWWLAYSDVTGKPVAFAGLKINRELGYGYLCLAGVSKKHRGCGLQKRLIDARVAQVRRLGLKRAITYVVTDNWPSANSLVSRGFRMYSPQYPYVGRKDVIYFQRSVA